MTDLPPSLNSTENREDVLKSRSDKVVQDTMIKQALAYLEQRLVRNIVKVDLSITLKNTHFFSVARENYYFYDCWSFTDTRNI